MDGLVLSRNVEVGDAVSSILVLGSQATLIMTLGDVGDVYVLGQGGPGRYRQGLPGPARAHRGGVLQGQEVRRPGHEDLAARRGEGQRDHVRGARLDSQPRRRAQSQHERQRRDHPGREEERPAGAGSRGGLRQAAQDVPSRFPTQPTRRAAGRSPSNSASPMA